MEKFNPSSLLKYFRQKMGMTQSAMATHLNVSRSLVCMAEKNQRKLPAAAEYKMKLLFDHFSAILKKDRDHVPVLNTAARDLSELYGNIEFLKMGAERQLPALQLKLEIMKGSYVHHSQHANVLDKLFADGNTGTDWDEQVKRSYERSRLELEKCGVVQQGKIELKIDLLLAEIEVLNRHMETLITSK